MFSVTTVFKTFNSSYFHKKLYSISFIKSYQASYSSLPFNSSTNSDLLLNQNLQSNQQLEQKKSVVLSKSRPKSIRKVIPKSSHVSFNTISQLQANQIPITMLTAHDFQSARLLAMAAAPKLKMMKKEEEEEEEEYEPGIDICLCGDSLAMVALGYQSTNELRLDEYISHLKAVRRGIDSVRQRPDDWPGEIEYVYREPLLIADLPFGTYEGNSEKGLETSLNLISKGRIDGVKIEGGIENLSLMKRLNEFDIPVIGHLGLLPQRIAGEGGMKVQGHKDFRKAEKIIENALTLIRSGYLKGLVLEAIPNELCSIIKEELNQDKIKDDEDEDDQSIFLIGIGAGQKDLDGQVLVQSDLLGSLDFIKPKFVLNDQNVLLSSSSTSTSSFNPNLNLNPIKSSWDLGQRLIENYIKLVRLQRFPDLNGLHSYKMDLNLLKKLEKKKNLKKT
ncbi:hypothetical protein CROQUDRAFT_131771 [Cronartium quercuum f. sp. fusiforme G11]|uniref:3-methyl-2-oxobutanoate hydroxymethyltransferase n=1 Tax=Cronartium quercuum f. sp. fusiforme G11 TaxID=708437 RepID=A0A9P6TEC7_9BASI|nr:hypothetical protein CROQUDRAFT_131771 [Cronartium quercuum f. sp. fusiforme G11]